ncbi:hypothetical protein P152DRAFT_121281 [Eremomyces bilateralis CBS 781.70]|uniref:Uncharacterized protein n=1 Tax=Eremomyces bilateralis CBS 781.70 TaxID=1392243 RepID=A0A6G1GE94_9PEZI|nr:uncharacterized protein P152DRAFT_121281 [Eremomyces bilateralis CBS 781.70]KAF1816378.1 hypothetical protein P152DRAFT_121281 [Eremomyces bilateralis CBS 781.70]
MPCNLHTSMLARSSSDAGARLRRAKSTPSTRRSFQDSLIQSKYEDPESRQQHALAAATRAFERAQVTERDTYTPRADVGKKRTPQRLTLMERQREMQMRRQTVKKHDRRPLELKSWQSANPSLAASNRRDRDGYTCDGVGARSSPIIAKSLSRTRSLLSRMSRADLESESRASNVTAALRRSKSLSNAKGCSVYGSQTEDHSKVTAPRADNSQNNSTEAAVEGAVVSDEFDAHEANISPESEEYSNFIGANDVSPSAENHTESWWAEETRRRQRVEQTPNSSGAYQAADMPDALEQQQSQCTPSNITFSPASPATGFGSEAASSSLFHSKGKRLSMTSTLKSKMKQLFRRTSLMSIASSPPTHLPIQQATASRTYFGDFVQTTTFGGSPVSGHGTGSLSDIVSPAVDAASRRTSRQPSETSFTWQTACPSSPSVHRKLSSTSSELSNTGEKSRVTSWADSTYTAIPTDNLGGRDAPFHSGMHGPLSVIPESHPPSQPSQLGRSLYNTLMSLTKHKEAKRQNQQQPPAPETHPECGQEGCAYGSLGIAHEHVRRISYDGKEEDVVLPSQKSRNCQSQDASLASRSSQVTIRAVPPELAMNFSTASLEGLYPNDEQGDLGLGYAKVTPETDVNADSKLDDALGEELSTSRQVGGAPQQADLPTTSLIASRVERNRNRWQAPLEEDRSFFFPRTSHGNFRSSVECQLDRIIEANPPPSMAAQEVSLDLRNTVMSPSVYSQDGRDTPLGDGDSGTAVIMESSPVKSFALSSRTSPHRRTPTEGSRDWKAWLSKEVADLGSSPNEGLSVEEWERYSLPPRGAGHRREHAEIVEEEPTILDDITSGAETPTDTTQDEKQVSNWESIIRVERIRPRLQERSASRTNEGSPMFEAGRNNGERSSNSPRIPSRSQTPMLTDRRTDTRIFSGRDKENAPPNRHLALPQAVPGVRRPMSLQALRPRTTSNVYEEDETLTRIRAGPYASALSPKDDNDSPHSGRNGANSPAHTPSWMERTKTPSRLGKENQRRAPISSPPLAESSTPSTGGQRLAERFLNERRDKTGESKWKSESPIFL